MTTYYTSLENLPFFVVSPKPGRVILLAPILLRVPYNRHRTDRRYSSYGRSLLVKKDSTKILVRDTRQKIEAGLSPPHTPQTPPEAVLRSTQITQTRISDSLRFSIPSVIVAVTSPKSHVTKEYQIFERTGQRSNFL